MSATTRAWSKCIWVGKGGATEMLDVENISLHYGAAIALRPLPLTEYIAA